MPEESKAGQPAVAVVEKQATEQAKAKVLSLDEVDSLIKKARQEEFDRLNNLLSRQGAELKRLKEEMRPRISQPSFHRDGVTEVMLQEMRDRVKETGEPNPRIAQLEAMLAQEKAREAQLADAQWRDEFANQEKEELEQDIKDVGLKPDDPLFDVVWDEWDKDKAHGAFDRAHRKLDRILRSKSKPVQESKVSEPEKKELSSEEKEEIVRQYLISKGRNVTETRNPTASKGGLSAEEFAKMSPEGRLANIGKMRESFNKNK